MKTIYFISGLGADERVFAALELPNIRRVYIEWVEPAVEDSLEDYAVKLLDQIDQNQKVIILGLSFGGMLAVELGKLIPTSQIIALSTAINRAAIPQKYKWLGKWKVPDKVPFVMVRKANVLTYYFFGIQTPKYQLLLKDILLETNEVFFRWAIGAILNWKNEENIPNLVQIHGTKDKILPFITNENVLTVSGGGHFMVLEEAEKVSKLLLNILE